MIDLHSHILPELDDGARNLEDSLEMARMAVQSGVTVMTATPHCAGDQAREVYSAYRLFRAELEEYGIPLKLLPGMEIFGTRDTARLLRGGKLLTLNGSRYPLVEFSFRSSGEEETGILRSIIDAGYQPLVAHPERYYCIQHYPEIANLWKRMGCLFQVNRGSLLGRFGESAKNSAMELTRRGFASVVASDAHSPHRRTTWMADVREMIQREISPTAAEYLLLRNPALILRNKQLSPAQPDWFDE